MKTKDLENEIIERKESRKEIERSINEYCKTYYGIDNFSSVINELFARQRDFGVCLARQVPTVNIEHLAKHLFVRWLNHRGISAEAIALGFTADSFSTKNDLKRSYCKIPYYLTQHRWIVRKKERGSLDGRTLAKILTVDGETLSAHHQDLRRRVFGNNSLKVDVSNFFLECLRECLNNSATEGRPEHLFVERLPDREKLIRTEELNGQKILRPVADWYYPLYLLFFVDGSRALLSTVDDDKKVSSWFKEANNKIEEITGFSSLIIHTPKEVNVDEYRSNLLEIPQWVFRNNWQGEIDSMPLSDSTLFGAYEFFEKWLLKSRE